MASLIVVESFTAVWWLVQVQITSVVAVMGATVSQMQASLITGLVPEDGRIWLFPDGDQTSVCMAESALKLLSPHRFVRWVKLDNGKQPTDAGPSELQKLLPMI